MSASVKRRAAAKLLQAWPNGLDLALRSCSTLPSGAPAPANVTHANRLLGDPSCTSSALPVARSRLASGHGLDLPAAIAACTIAALSGLTVASCDAEVLLTHIACGYQSVSVCCGLAQGSSHCPAHPQPGTTTRCTGHLQGTPGISDPRSEVKALWEDIQQDIGRMDAALPATRATTSLHDPSVDLTPGWISITLPIRDGVSLAHLEAALRRLEPVPDRHGAFHVNSSRTSVRPLTFQALTVRDTSYQRNGTRACERW